MSHIAKPWFEDGYGCERLIVAGFHWLLYHVQPELVVVVPSPERHQPSIILR